MPKERVFNFSAGPAALPTPVLERAQQELLDWRGTGMSVMEVSHRGADFIDCAAQAEANLRKLLAIPENYKVLFLAGGATLQFASIPLNLTRSGDTVDYVLTGNWGKKAVSEAKRYCSVHIAADAATTGYTQAIPASAWQLSDAPKYVHYTPNETIHGVEYQSIPDIESVPLVADFSSSILSRPLDVSRFSLIYAGAQKNIGPAGLGVLIVREDLIGHARTETPGVIDYKTMSDTDSMWNTPPTFAWYLAGLVFEWLLDQGGLAAIERINKAKSEKLYRYIDESDFYANPVEPASRSRMNVPFTLADEAMNAPFLAEAADAGLMNLKGHRAVGGMRASIYNAVPPAAIDALIAFMADFEQRRA
ncbi:MAG: 3-phosphoserine/phosphohydroxythreonine transaminase [Gammaproteobacteria bacterium]|jgi:phosphoserine aminotransferase